NSNLNLCLNEKLFVQTNTSFDAILWSTGSTNDYISVTAPGNYYVYAHTNTGCVLKDTFQININGEAPTANFSTSYICEDAATIFSDSSTAASGSTITSWKWTFGDGNSSFANQPTNVYTTNGNYTVGFKVTTNQGCSDSISRVITVNKRPTASFYNLLSCSGLPTTFVDQSLANATSVTDWIWDFGGLGSSNAIQNPTFQFPAAGTYNVQLTAVNDKNCRDSITLPITVKASPTANFSFDSACGISPIHFQYLATVPLPATLSSWKWDFGDGTFENAIKNAEHQYSVPGTYNVKLTVQSSDQCSNTIEKQVKSFDFPIVDFTISPTQCVGKEINFTDISYTPDGTPITQWNWYFSGQATSTQQHPTYAFNQQGNYTIQLTAKNAVGCSGTKLRSVAVSDPPIPAFTFSPQNGLPPLIVNFINQTVTSSNFIWDYGDGSPTYIGNTAPPHTYSTLGTYPIKLIATDFKGCSDSVVKQILVDKAIVDAVLTGITVIPDGEYYKVQITVVNNSNVEIRNLGLAMQLGGGAQVVENWTGSLLPGADLIYNFIGKIKLNESAVPVVCATIENVNNYTTETRIDNNSTCKEVVVGDFAIINMYPNPAETSINLGIMLPKAGEVNIRFIDMLGHIMYSSNFYGAKGYNAFSMTTMPLNAAIYVAEITYNGQTLRQKFMRKDK
ncbi:MAG: PKD domain-containing protein, partial [Bacteroidetes bacterium]|nr:PKD domain-containing protein [Bacteroidota bacterium]